MAYLGYDLLALGAMHWACERARWGHPLLSVRRTLVSMLADNSGDDTAAYLATAGSIPCHLPPSFSQSVLQNEHLYFFSRGF